MISAPIPENEDFRLKELYRYNILDSDQEADYDDLAELVSHICECPIALITFVDRDRPWFKATRNVADHETSRDEAFCAHTILEREVMIVNDASRDERFFDNPHVTGGLNIGFYAGAPIKSSSGYQLGSVCAIDNKPRELSESQVAALERVARQVSRLLEMRLLHRQMVDTTQQLIEKEKKITQLNLVAREMDNWRMANSLHEDIAQITAAVKLRIDVARNSQCNAGLLQDAASELNKATQLIRSLSRSITPTTYQQDQYCGHLRDFVNETTIRTEKEISYHFDGEEAVLQGYFGLMIFRLIEDLFRLAKESNYINLQLYAGHRIRIFCEFDEAYCQDCDDQNMVEANVGHRIEMLSGRFKKLHPLGSRHVIYEVVIPQKSSRISAVA